MYDHNLFVSPVKVANMRERNIRIFTALFIFFLLDILKPFGYNIHVDMLFCGITAISLIYPYFPALFWSVFFGYLTDCMSINTSPINTIETFFIFMIIRYVFKQFPAAQARIILPIALNIMHIWLRIYNTHAVSYFFAILVFIQSILLYYAVNYILKSWMKFQPVEYS